MSGAPRAVRLHWQARMSLRTCAGAAKQWRPFVDGKIWLAWGTGHLQVKRCRSLIVRSASQPGPRFKRALWRNLPLSRLCLRRSADLRRSTLSQTRRSGGQRKVRFPQRLRAEFGNVAFENRGMERREGEETNVAAILAVSTRIHSLKTLSSVRLSRLCGNGRIGVSVFSVNN